MSTKLTFGFHVSPGSAILYAGTYIGRDRRTLERAHAGVSVSPRAASERRDGGRIFRDSGEWAKELLSDVPGGNMGARDRDGRRGPMNKRLALRGYTYLTELP